MFELGNIQNEAYNQRAAYTEQNRISDIQKTKASTKISNGDKAEAASRNSLDTKTEYIMQDSQNNGNIFLSDNSLEDDITDFREKVTAFRLLADEIVNNYPPTQKIIQDLQAHIEEIMKVAEGSKHIIYADIGKMLEKIRKEIQAINSSEGFLFGVRDRIEEFAIYTELNLSQFLEMEQKTAEQDEISESARFSSSRIKQESQKALQFQANINHDRALKLLTN
jgi:hypothetical protein